MILAPAALYHSHKTKRFKNCMCNVSLPFANETIFFLCFFSLSNWSVWVCGFPACVSLWRHVSLISPPSHVIVLSTQTHVFTCRADPSFFSPAGWKLEAGQFLYVTHFIPCPDTLHVACKKKLSLCLICFFSLLESPEISRHWIHQYMNVYDGSLRRNQMFCLRLPPEREYSPTAFNYVFVELTILT